MGGACLQRVRTLRQKLTLIIGKVATVGFERIGARSAFRGERVEKPVDETARRRFHLPAFGNWIVWVISRGLTFTKFASA